MPAANGALGTCERVEPCARAGGGRERQGRDGRENQARRDHLLPSSGTRGG
jgi:hypothetical protein